MVQRRNSTSIVDSEEIARFQCLFPNPSWLTSGRTSKPYVFGKQLSMSLINLGKMDVKMMMMMMKYFVWRLQELQLF